MSRNSETTYHEYRDIRHYHPPVLLMWGLVVGGIAVFCVLAFAVSNDITTPIDTPILLALRDPVNLSDAWGPPWFEESAAELTALGGYPILVTVSIIVLAILVLYRHVAAAVFLFFALVGGTALSTGLKLFFSRSRPDLVTHMDETFTSSFPSGHATVSMLAYLTMAFIAIRFVPHHSVRMFILSGAFLLAVIIGASRVYLGVHWPSDVLAGWSLGLSWASFTWLVAHYLTVSTSSEEELGHSRT